MDKRKTYLLIGLFLIAIIIAFAIYKGVGSSQTTTTSTTGGTTSETTNGIGQLAGSVAAFFGI